MNRDNDEALCSLIHVLLPNIKFGTLRFWGKWFGRPYDNQHRVIQCKLCGDHVAIDFDGGEILQVWNASDFQLCRDKFEIRHADRVRWNWYFYGKPPKPENLYFLDYCKTGKQIELYTNVNWYSPELTFEAQGNAVDIL